jgi:hypothetical protein
MATKTRKVGRDAGTEEFIPVKEAQKRKATAIVQTIPAPAPKPAAKKKPR